MFDCQSRKTCSSPPRLITTLKFTVSNKLLKITFIIMARNSSRLYIQDKFSYTCNIFLFIVIVVVYTCTSKMTTKNEFPLQFFFLYLIPANPQKFTIKMCNSWIVFFCRYQAIHASFSICHHYIFTYAHWKRYEGHLIFNIYFNLYFYFLSPAPVRYYDGAVCDLQ